LGRLGLLDLLTATRLPWLILGGLGPALSWWNVRRRMGPLPALAGALVVLLFPGWWPGVVGGASWPIVVSCCLLAVGIHTAPYRPWCRVALVSLVIGFGTSVHVAASIALGVIVGYSLWTSKAAGWRHGRVTLPTTAVAGVGTVWPLVWCFNPALWGRSTPELVRWWLTLALPSASESPLAVGWWNAGWALVVLGAVATTAALVRRRLA